MTTGMKDQVGGTTGNDDFTMEVDATWSSSSAKNPYTHDTIPLAGLNRSFDHYDGLGGNDTLNGTPGGDALIYDTAGSAKDSDPAHYVSIERFVMGAGNDVLDLTGPGGAGGYGTGVSVFGDAAASVSTGGTLGKDVLWTGDGNDNLFGDAVELVSGTKGGADVLHGGAGNDTIAGDANNMGATGRGGNDVLDGGTGNDVLYGDSIGVASLGYTRGDNEFRFDGPGSGQDTIGGNAINGFQPDHDKIRLASSYGYGSGAGVLHNHTADVGGRAVVDLGHGDTITLAGVTTSQLHDSNFVIA